MADHHTHLVWVDIEATSLPTEHDDCIDFSDVHILEFAMIVTDRSLNIHEVGGYVEVVGMTQEARVSLLGNEAVRKMHVENGLIQDCINSKKPLYEVEQEASMMLYETGIKPGKFALAGSGIAMYDFPLIRAKMPEFSRWLAYYPYDIGVYRRVSRDLAGRDLINPRLDSYGASKLHRAFNDVEAHLREAQRHRDWLRQLPSI